LTRGALENLYGRITAARETISTASIAKFLIRAKRWIHCNNALTNPYFLEAYVFRSTIEFIEKK
jgi:hypothetical protein